MPFGGSQQSCTKSGKNMLFYQELQRVQYNILKL